MNNYAPFQAVEKVCRARAREERKKKRKKEEKKKKKKDIARRRWRVEKEKKARNVEGAEIDGALKSRLIDVD